MSPPSVSMRCPACGQPLRAVLAPAPSTQWFPCPSCHAPVPVVVPRDLPPLYSWEVVPGLYPPLAVPKRPRWRPAHIASLALVVAAALSVASAGILAYDGFVAAEPAQYAISGTVYEESGGVLRPASGASVVLSVNGNIVGSTTTGPFGTFSFPRVSAGGIQLNVTASGFAPTVVYTFASQAYSTQTGGLDITLEPGTTSNTSVTVLTPFDTLEALLATLGGAAVLLFGAGGAAAVAAVAIRRPEGGVPGVIGAGAAVAVPILLVLFAVAGAFPLATAVAGGAGAAGGFALVFASAEVASR